MPPHAGAVIEAAVSRFDMVALPATATIGSKPRRADRSRVVAALVGRAWLLG